MTLPSTTNNYSGSIAVMIDWDESTLINLPAYFIWSCNSSHLSELGNWAVWDRYCCMDFENRSGTLVKRACSRYIEIVPGSTASVLGAGVHSRFFFKSLPWRKHKRLRAHLSQWLHTLGSSGFRPHAPVVKPRTNSKVSRASDNPILYFERGVGKKDKWLYC